MPFQKGISGNLAGKPKGLKNTKTRIVQEFIESILDEDRQKRYAEALDKLDDKIFVERINDLLEYVIPKKVRSEVEQTNINIDYENMSDDELRNEIANKLQSQ